MGALAVRSRIEARPEPGLERLYDPLLDDLVHGGPLARERFPVRWDDDAGLSALAAAKRRALPRELSAEMTEYHRRLGASAASLAALDRLARGEAVCTVAGQQPAPLGGPLYSLHKIAAAAGSSVVVRERTGTPCVPLFWMHGEDSDFTEIRGASLADPGLALHELELPATAHGDGQLVGGIATAPLEALQRRALAVWAGLPGEGEARVLLERSLERARDLGEAFSALVLALFPSQGVVVADPRLPAFRAAARPVLERYFDRAPALAEAARRAGARLEAALGRRPLADHALDSFVFAILDGTRRKVTPEEARALGPAAPLSPSVALRPVVQDHVFPTVAMACGPGETAYLAQLREVFEGLEVRPACPMPRLSATWLPPAAATLIEASGAGAWAVISGADAALRRVAETRMPPGVLPSLARARTQAVEGLARFAELARQVDASLPQMVESARGKVDYQFARLEEGLIAKVRHVLERQHPEWLRLRYYLLPGDRLQERRLASLEVVARRGATAVGELCELAADHARRVAAGTLEHLVVDL
ncbi:MAG TPA: bacillithiol biosynthesis BshC [Candidatus Eisenbacteria bacterium]